MYIYALLWNYPVIHSLKYVSLSATLHTGMNEINKWIKKWMNMNEEWMKNEEFNDNVVKHLTFNDNVVKR